jgi:hypothetical protein
MTGLWSTTDYAWDPIDLLGRQLGELADRETRLLAAGVGEHCPHEVLVNVEQVRTERARLLAFSAPTR